MDRGMADGKNRAWLRQQGYRYVVVSRQQHREFECEGEPESNGKAGYCRKPAGESGEDGTPCCEAHPWCRPPDRERRETGIPEHFRRRFEDGLAAIGEQPAKPRGNRRRAAIGRLQKASARIARHFRIEVDTDPDRDRVQGIRGYCEPVEGSMAMHPGVYCLRSNITDRGRGGVSLPQAGTGAETRPTPEARACRGPPVHPGTGLPGGLRTAYPDEGPWLP